MLHLPRSARIGLACLALGAPARLAPQDSGITYVTRAATTGTGVLSPPKLVGSGRVLVRGRDMRVEYTDAVPSGLLCRGRVLLSFDDGARVVVLDTVRRFYATLDPAALARALAMNEQRAGASQRPVAPEVRVEHLGPGEQMLGEPTDRWRFVYRVGVKVALADAEGLLRTEVTEDYWFGRTPLEVRTGPAQSGGVEMSSFGDPTLAERLAAARRKLPQRLPLRTVSTQVLRADDEELLRHTTTVDVVAVSRAPVPASAFAIPPEYAEVPLLTLLSSMPPAGR